MPETKTIPSLTEVELSMIQSRAESTYPEMSNDFTRLVLELRRLREAARWRRLGEEKPPKWDRVLVEIEPGHVTEAIHYRDENVWDHNWHAPCPALPTHRWLPMPKPEDQR